MKPKTCFLVVSVPVEGESGKPQLFEITLDEKRARQAAAHVNGFVVELPIAFDYR